MGQNKQFRKQDAKIQNYQYALVIIINKVFDRLILKDDRDISLHCCGFLPHIFLPR